MNRLFLLLIANFINAVAMNKPDGTHSLLSKAQIKQNQLEEMLETTKEPTQPFNHIVTAIKRNHLDLVKDFIASGIDINQGYAESAFRYPSQDQRGNIIILTEPNDHRRYNTPLMYASLYGRTGIVVLLLEAGANPNLQNMQKHTALTLCNGHTDIMKILLENKANPNIHTFQGFTALMYALMCRNEKQVELLMKHGANPLLTNDMGISADYYAFEAGETFVERVKCYTIEKRLEDTGFEPALLPIQNSETMNITFKVFTIQNI